MSRVPVDAHQILCANMIDLMDSLPLGDNHFSSRVNKERIGNNDKLSWKLQQLDSESRRLNRTDKSRLLSPSGTRKCLAMDGCEVMESITEKKQKQKQKQKQIQHGRRRSAKCSHHKNALLASNMSLKHFNSALVFIILSLYTISLLNCCINQIKLANAGELPIELNGDNKVIQIHRISNMMKQQQQNNHLSLPLNLIHNDDGDSVSDVGTSESTNTDESSNDNYESDNSTQIPFENDDSIYGNNNNNNNNNNKNNRQTTTRRPFQGAPTTTSATIQSANAIKQRSSASSMRITEIDLLPFSEFTVQQPAFSDLMRSWPPTTLQTTIAAADSANKRVLARQQLRGGQQQQQQHFEQGGGGGGGGGQMGAGNGYRGAPNRHQQHHSLQQQQRQFDLDHAQLESFASVLQRNHLNEDFDDTVVTADQSFESDELAEPPTWINYLGEWGDYIYFQLQQYLDNNNKAFNNDNEQQQSADSSNNNNNNNNNNSNETVTSALQQLKIESIDELLDDYYYDQYENSQVLYYGPQLVREGDIFEIGCFMPNDQQAEWSKSGKPLLADKIQLGGSPRVIRRSDFLGAKQNFSLKIFEASLNDRGNYRCNKMSRKYHKLVVVPLKASTSQVYHIQQRLLSVVNPGLMSSQSTSSMTPIGGTAPPTRPPAKHQLQATSSGSRQLSKIPQGRNHLVPGYLIMENRPLVVNCHIADEQVLRSLRENSQFKLKWYKNGKQLRGYYALPMASNHLLSQTSNNNQAATSSTSNSRRNEQYSRGRSTQQQKQQQEQQQSSSSASFTSTLGVISPQSRPMGNNQRIQFLQANGRQLYISGAQYSDAGDYSCLWSGLGQAGDSDARNSNSNSNSNNNNNNNQEQESAPSSNILGDGSLVQLLAPVKLRPFKSTYNVRQGNQLRLICLAQRGHPAAHISWYVGNRLVDNEFLREHPEEFRIIQASGAVGGQQHARSQVIVTSSPPSGGGGGADYGSSGDPKRRIVEINPVPASRQQMQMTANGRGQWIEYRDFRNDKYAIETGEQQSKYLQLKLAQLTGPSTLPSNTVGGGGGGNGQVIVSSDKNQLASSLLGQTSISVLVINSLNLDKHTSRFACRATTRANTDEVTTVIRVQAANTVSLRPASGRATLIPGQALHFQCQQLENKEAQFLWYLRPVDSEKEQQLDPNNDESFEIHNDRLTIRNPKVSSVGDYICRVKDDESNEFAIIKLRTMPYIEDFGLETSHTGRSSSVVDGGRLELNCTVRDTRAPVNITWLRSLTPDDDRSMIPITEVASSTELATDADMPTYWSPDSVVAESMGTHSKRLIIESVRPEHRSFYVCMADNGVTERTKKVIFIRVKDRLNALWPFLGIVAELFILFIIIHVWETQRAYKEITAAPLVAQTSGGASSKRPASGISVPFENVPLTAS